MLLAFRDFGLKDVSAFANRQYNFGRKDTPTPYQYIVLMSDLKKEVRTAMDLILVNVRIANRVRVDSEMEFHKRLEHQNKALFYKLLPDNTRKEMLAYFEILYDCKITIRKVKHKYKMFFSQN